MIKVGRGALSYEQRMAIIRLYESGCRICDISKQLGITRKTIYLWLKRYEDEGSLEKHTRQVYERSTSSVQDAEIIASHFANPFLSTQESSAKYNVSTETIRRRLRQAGLAKYRFGVRPHLQPERKPDRSKKSRSKIKCGETKASKLGNLTTIDSGQHSYDNSKCDMLQTVPFPEVPNDFQNAVMSADGQNGKMCLENMPHISAEIYNPAGFEPGTVCLGANGTVAATPNDDMEVSNSMSHEQMFGTEQGLNIEYCSECNGELVGCRYVCVQCAECAVCAACEARGAHHHHYALRVPQHKDMNEVKTILEKIRSILQQETLAEDDIIQEEVFESYGGEWRESSSTVKNEPQDTSDDAEQVLQTDEDTSTDMYSDTQNESPALKSARKRFRPNILKKTTRRIRSIVDDRHVCEPEIQITVEEVDGENQGLPYSTRYEQASSSNTSCEIDLVPIMETNKDSRMLIPIYMSKSQRLKSNDLKNLQIKPDPLISVPPHPAGESHSEESNDPLLTADPLLIKTESPD